MRKYKRLIEWQPMSVGAGSASTASTRWGRPCTTSFYRISTGSITKMVVEEKMKLEPEANSETINAQVKKHIEGKHHDML